MNTLTSRLLVFSDLDGSLLDHFTYDFEAALSVVQALEQLGIPLILASSKTAPEMLALREALANKHPFIIENGAALYIPRNYFPGESGEPEGQGEYLVHELAPPRERWLAELAALRDEFPDQFESFHSAGTAGIVAMTGLSELQAAAAGNRGYSEPVQWLGTPLAEQRFTQRLRENGATVVRGGRFLTVTGDCDKGRALTWLRDAYQRAGTPDGIEDLAIGDSDNDRTMLQAAKTALLIRSPVHGFPTLDRDEGVLHSEAVAPAGWAEGVSRWLQQKGITI